MSEDTAIKILDSGYVCIVDTWGSDASVIEAARMSTNKGFVNWESEHTAECDARNQARPSQCDAACTKGDRHLLAYLYNNQHMTPFEMAGLVIEVKAPIMVFREWHRHRTQSYNEMSARYVPLPNENYVPDIADLINRAEVARTSANRQATSGSTHVLDYAQAERDLNALVEYYAQGQILYDRFLNNGWPKELARLPVPVARYSRMRAQANLRNWLGFLTLRMAPNAQQEIRMYADAVFELIMERFPRTAKLFADSNLAGEF